MTVCAAFRHGHNVWIGADSAASWDPLIQSVRDSKIVRREGWAAAIAGSFRVRDLLETFDAPPVPRTGIRRYVLAEFLPSLVSHCKAHDVGTDSLADEVRGFTLDVELILVVRNRLFYVGEDLGLNEPEIVTIGTGGSVALGVLRALRETEPRARLRTALRTAIEQNMDCKGPIRIVRV